MTDDSHVIFGTLPACMSSAAVCIRHQLPTYCAARLHLLAHCATLCPAVVCGDAASRDRGVFEKAVSGSITEYVMNRVACACLVVKPMVGDRAEGAGSTAHHSIHV